MGRYKPPTKEQSLAWVASERRWRPGMHDAVACALTTGKASWEEVAEAAGCKVSTLKRQVRSWHDFRLRHLLASDDPKGGA